ncbi:MAG TPA: AraC family transcriptional regulator, partial [Calditrichia bacterium]|nr:AraC family transcriptional regulator [Calditrichia bacterium]
YTPANYSLISVDLPVVGQVTEASPEKPYLCLKIDLNQRDFSELLADTGQLNVPDLSTRRGYFVGKVDDALTDSILRLARLMEAPQDIPLLGPLTLREVYYRLLKSDCAPMIAQLVVNGSNLQRISSAIEKLKTGYQEPVRVGELAGMVGMSVSSFHFHFKEITAMSPLQYQKRLRLMEARRLMMVEAVDAAGAAYRVGYESPSQFSREYARMFGNPPARDIKVLRSVAADA